MKLSRLLPEHCDDHKDEDHHEDDLPETFGSQMGFLKLAGIAEYIRIAPVFFPVEIFQIMLPAALVGIDLYIRGGEIPVDRAAVSLTLDCCGYSCNWIGHLYIKIVVSAVSETPVLSGSIIGNILPGDSGYFPIGYFAKRDGFRPLPTVEEGAADICNDLIQRQYAGHEKDQQGRLESA